jgi:hypothetical protein
MSDLFPDLAVLRATTGTTAGQTVHLAACSPLYPGGGGRFRWDPEAIAADDGGALIRPDGSARPGGWRREQVQDVRDFGADAQGMYDSTAAFARYWAWAAAHGQEIDQEMVFPRGTYLLSGLDA